MIVNKCQKIGCQHKCILSTRNLFIGERGKKNKRRDHPTNIIQKNQWNLARQGASSKWLSRPTKKSINKKVFKLLIQTAQMIERSTIVLLPNGPK